MPERVDHQRMPAHATPAPPLYALTLRVAYFGDRQALHQLAQLDSADHVPPAPVLLAEVDGELRAALSLSDGAVIADPFHPTADLLALLRAHAASLTAPRRRRQRFSIRTRSAAPTASMTHAS
jgi:hypothetical protein